MKNYQKCVTLVILAMLMNQPDRIVLASTPSRSNRPKTNSAPVVPGVVVIKLKQTSPVSLGGLPKVGNITSALLKSAGVTSLSKAFPAARPLAANTAAPGKVDLSRIYFAHIGAEKNPVDVALRLEKSGEFDYAEPKYIHHLLDTPNDAYYADFQAVYFNQMNAPNGWAIAKGSASVVIADVDGGTYWQHPDLLPNLWINPGEDINHNGTFDRGLPAAGDENGIDDDGNGFKDDVIGWNFANNSNDPTGNFVLTPGDAAHGTATASHFGASTNNGQGMAGPSWNCHIMLINAGSPTADENIEFGYEGIQYAFANGAKVINCSWGRTGAASKFEQDVIDAAAQAGALVVVAAGNGVNGFGTDNDFLPNYPANYRNVLSIGATISGLDVLPYFSNYGLTVSVYAPGTDIFSAFVGGSYGNGGSGTSYSCSLVSGLAGLVKSYRSSLTPAQLALQIRMSADSIPGFQGHGRVNFVRALQENHAGLQVLTSSLLTPSGDRLFLPGDTAVLKVRVVNPASIAASNVSFFVSASDPLLQVLQGPAGPISLAPADSFDLGPFLFKIGSVTSAHDIAVQVLWTYNVSDRDGYAFKLRVYPGVPQWDVLQSPTSTSLFSVTATDRNVVWAAGGDGNETNPVVLRTVDGGSTWKLATGNLTGVDLFCINAIDASRAWVGTGAGTIYATTDGGVSWSQQSYPGTQSPFIDGIEMFANLTGYALGDPASGGKFVVLKTTNGGASWSHLANEPTGASTEAGWNNSFWWTDQSHGWFGTNNSEVWRTTDGGSTWYPGTTLSASSLAVSFSDASHGIAGFEDGTLASTSDGGITWSAVPGFTGGQITGAAFLAGTNSLWVTDDATAYRSTDRGSSWQPQLSWPFDGSIMHVAFADTTAGWMVTSFGEVLRYNVQTITSAGPAITDHPRSFALEQNYPNPFNPSTTIQYYVPLRSRVRLTVYNILGQQIEELVNKEVQAGSYEQVWKSTSSSGIYLCRFEAVPLDGGGQRFVQVRKLVLLK